MDEEYPELSREELLQRYGRQDSRAPGSERRSPFKFLDSYDLDDADIFFGRDTEIEELLRHFRSYGHVLIYGESGSGKSSLVQCGLRSQIPEADALFIPLRVHTAGLPSVCHQIWESASQQLGEAVEESPEAGLVETLRTAYQEASRPIVLFFDQFEELFIFHESDIRQRFAEELASIQTERLNVKVMIGVRQDYLGHLSELEDTVEGLFDNRFWLRRMSRENAAQAVVKACATCDVAIDDELAQAILHRLDPAGQGVELPYLQVVMDRLYRQAVAANPARPVITVGEVEKLGDITDILGTFLVEEVAKLPSPDTGRQILKAFVTREATRRSLDRDAVGQEAAGFGGAIPKDALDAHLNQLASVRILREIANTDSYELRHDALAATVAGWISEIEKELIEVRDNLINRFREYEARNEDTGALLDQGFLDYLAVYRDRLRPLLNEELRRYVKESQRHVGQAAKARRRVRQVVTGVVGSLVLACLVMAVWQWRAATQREQEAKTNLVTAERQRKEADDAKANAEEQRKQADLATANAEEQRKQADLATANAEEQRKQADLATAKAEEQQKRADDAKKEAERNLYINRIQSAHREWGANNAAAAWRHLDASKEELRGWEYHFLHALFNANYETLEGHTKAVTSVAFNSDGSRIVSSSEGGTIRRWDADTGKEMLPPLGGHAGSVTSVAFSPDGSRIVSGSEDDTVKLWDADTGEELSTLKGHSGWVLSVAFSPDGSRIVSGSKDGTIKRWDAGTGEELSTLKGHSGWVLSVAFSPDGSRIVSGMGDGTLKLWDARTDEETGPLMQHTAPVRSVAFSPDGSHIVSGSEDDTVKLWDVRTGEEKRTLEGHGYPVTSVAFSPDGSRVVSGSQDMMLKLWDVGTGEELATLKGHSGWVLSVAFSPDGSRIVSGSHDNRLNLWDARTGEETLTLKEADKAPQGEPRPNQRQQEAVADPITVTRWVNSVAFNDDGSRIVSGGSDETLRLWDALTGEELPSLKGHTDAVRSVAFSPGGSRIVSGSDDKTLKVWDADTSKELWTGGQTAPVRSVAFSSDGSHIVSGSNDMTLKLWDAGTGKEILSPLKGHTGSVTSVAFNHDGSRIVSGSEDGTLKQWDALTGEEILPPLEGHAGSVWSVAFNHDGSRIVSGGKDGTIKRWDALTGKELSSLVGHTGWVLSVAFNHDGSRIVSGSQDERLKLWDADTGEEMLTLEGHDHWVTTVAFSTDGSRIVSGSNDGTIRLWDAPGASPFNR